MHKTGWLAKNRCFLFKVQSLAISIGCQKDDVAASSQSSEFKGQRNGNNALCDAALETAQHQKYSIPVG